MDEKIPKFKGQINLNIREKNLDLTNRKILYLLSLNARYSHSAIAKTIGTTREVVQYRIKKLEQENFCEGYFTLIDVTRTKHQMYLLYVKLYNTKEYNEILKRLEKNRRITRLKEVTGTYDLQIIITTKTTEEADAAMDKIMSDFGDNIKNFIVMRIVEEDFGGLKLLAPENEIKKLKIKEFKGSSFQKEFQMRKGHEQVTLDEKDKKILHLLQLNARESIKNISTKINLAAPSVENRIKKLISQGVIKSMYPLLNLGQMGYQWYKVLLQVKNINKLHITEYLKEHRNILWYMKLIGNWNYQFSVFAKNNAEFHKILDEIRNEFSENIISYDSLVILNQQKFIQSLD